MPKRRSGSVEAKLGEPPRPDGDAKGVNESDGLAVCGSATKLMEAFLFVKKLVAFSQLDVDGKLLNRIAPGDGPAGACTEAPLMGNSKPSLWYCARGDSPYDTGTHIEAARVCGAW